MRTPETTRWSLILLVALIALPAGAAKPAVEVLDAPDVVVANPPENMTRENFNPEYVFSVEVRITNDDQERRVNTEAVIYTDRSVEDCTRDARAFPVMLFRKNRKLEPGETVRIGGSAHPGEGSQDAYWPLAVSRTYRDARTGENVSVESGEHTFCVTLRVSGEDPACDKPANRTCVLSPTPFDTYVRRTNSPPEVTEFEVSRTEIEPGQEVLFRADATDADTQPRPDILTYEWDLGPATETGKVVRYTYTTTGTHEVQLTVSDGFDTVQRTATVTVATEGSGGDGRSAPMPGLLAVLAGAVLAVLVRRR